MLTEKYRPQKYSELVGRSEVIEMIKAKTTKDGIPHLLFEGPPGTGKALTMDSDIITKHGIVKMKDLTIDDMIAGSDGNFYSIGGIFPQGKKECVELLFSDGTSVNCSLDHLWEVDRSNKSHKKTTICATTEEIIANISYKDHSNYSVNYIKSPINFPKRDVTIHPYLLGVWLGDGCISGNVRLSNPEVDIIDKISNLLSTDDIVSKINCESGYEYLIKRKQRSNDKSKLLQSLIEYGYSNATYSNYKFIPEDYLYSSIEDRIELLRGIADTDGTIERGTLIITTTSEVMATQIRQLVYGLGGKATISKKQKYYTYKGEKKEGLPSYDIIIYFKDLIPVSSKKHLAKYKPMSGKYFRKYIVGYRNIGKVDCQCISVNSPDKLFLTNDYTPTHNTTLAHVVANEIFGVNKSDLFFEFNASKDRGVEFIRTQIIDIAKRNPISGSYKIILMDEADNITPDAQACFRRIIEQYSTITRFIFCANYPYKLIEPILSRFVQVEFGEIDTKTVALQLKKIGVAEGYTLKDSEYIAMAKKARGDLRKALNLLEGGNIETDEDRYWAGMTYDKLISIPKDERILLAFKADPDVIFGKLFDMTKMEKKWQYLTALADCQAKMNMSVHKSVFLASFLEKLDK